MGAFAQPLVAQSLSDLRSFRPQPQSFQLLTQGNEINAVDQWSANCRLPIAEIASTTNNLPLVSPTFLLHSSRFTQGSISAPQNWCLAESTRPRPALKYLVPTNICSLSVSLEPIADCGISRAYSLPWYHNRIVLPSLYSVSAVRATSHVEHFHWRPALIQSLEFLLLEHGFRLATDPYARYLLIHKPFWHDYLSSSSHFVMSRWGDGDDFLVNYIGHPLEGSVSGNIQIQNDPKGRSLKFGKSSAYWKSRLRAMTWAAIYSAYFEIGPVLSEAALGNEGGYTYVPGCGLYPCNKLQHFKSPTNNTGWVDFTVTPLVGMGWIVLEDTIEAELIDRLAKDNPAFRFKVLRAALSPSRSMANMLAGKYPWYRYSKENENIATFGSAPRERQWSDGFRRNFGFQYTNLSLPMDWPGCSACRVNSSGVGLDFGYRLTHMIAAHSEINFFPGSGGIGGKGSAEEGLLGLKIGRPFHSWGLFGEIQPGFIHYDKALIRDSLESYQSVTRFVFDVGGVLEYYPSPHSAIRFSMGTTLVRYLSDEPDPKQPRVSVLSKEYIVTQGNLRFSSGYFFRF